MVDMNRDFGHVSQVLLDLPELNDMNSELEELHDRLLETEGEHEYAIRQIVASNETALRDTNSNYTTIIEDLKFRIKQMEREHLVEINKIQNKLKEERGMHGSSVDQLEKHYNEKLLAELKRVEDLNKLLNESKENYERLKIDMEEKLRISVTQGKEEHMRSVKEKIDEINELKLKLDKMEDEKEKSKLLLEEEFNKKKEDVGKSFVTKVLEKEMLIGKLKNENGILLKTHVIIRKQIQELEKKVKHLESEVQIKEENLKVTLQDTEMLKTQLEEREGVIAKKGKAVVKITKENDVFKKELLFRDTTIQALHESIAPYLEQLKEKDRLIDEQMKEINNLIQSRNKNAFEMKQLKKKLSLKDQEIRKQKMSASQLNAFLRKLFSKLLAPDLSLDEIQHEKDKIMKIVSLNEYEVCENNRTHSKIMARQYRMERIISALSKNLLTQTNKARVVERPGKSEKISLDVLTNFNQMLTEVDEKRKEVRYLRKLLEISRKGST